MDRVMFRVSMATDRWPLVKVQSCKHQAVAEVVVVRIYL